MMGNKLSALTAALALASVALWALGVCVGSTGFENIWQSLLYSGAGAEAAAAAASAWQIVWDIRLPRTLGAWGAGALLGLAGALAQGLFRNPLADPYLLGSASGAALGVALVLAALGGAAGMLGAESTASFWGHKVSVMSGHWLVRLGLTGAAFGGAVLAVLLTLGLARGVQQTLRLLLAGVVVGVVLGAVTSLVLLLTPDSLAAMQAFMLGSTGFVGWSATLLMLITWLACVCVAALLARALDALSLGEATATSLGLPLSSWRSALIAVLALATGTAVAQTGLIAFVGLAAPHLVRAVVRVTHGPLMLLASLMGAVLLTAADLLARWLIAPQELPVGVLTAVLGGGYLLWLMRGRGSLER
jgi:iron complex transport system permease protein